MKRRFAVAVLCGMQIFGAPWAVFAQTPNDPKLSEQWYLDQIDAYDAWDTTTGSSEIVVAVLDTGVDLDHPDLEDQIWTNEGEAPNDNRDNDGNGYVDDVNGWDFFDGDGTPEPSTSGNFDAEAVAHGTFIAGIIGAVGNNEEGVAGVNWDVKIMPLRILDKFGSGDSGRARRAVDYAVQNGADVINLSFSGFDLDEGLLQAIETAHDRGVVVVAAVGNEGVSLNGAPVYPACFTTDDEDLVIGVAATDDEDRRADFSNYGSDCTDISAPGVDVYSAMFYDEDEPDLSEYYGGYWSGTSVAAPMVSGAAALLLGAYPGLTPGQVRTILKLSVDPVAEKGTDAEGQMGAGRLNIAQALAIAPSFGATAASEVEWNGSRSLVVSVASGAPPTVTRFDGAGNELTSFDAYGGAFSGGVRVAMGDVDGDGVDEIVTVAGPGGGPQVRVFENDGSLRGQFFAYDQDQHHGVFVAAGDVDGDGVDEIIVSPDAGGGGEVRIFDMNGEQREFFRPFDATSKSLRVAAGDVDGDGEDEIVVGLGAGGRPRVRVYEASGAFIAEFDAYAPTYNKGIFVGTGDVDGDGVEEIVTGTDVGGGPHVRVFNKRGNVRASFFAYDEAFRGGVRIAVGDIDGNGTAEIYTAAGPGGGPHVRIFSAEGGSASGGDGDGEAIGGFFTDGSEPGDGIYLAVW